jgi:hypothetical protein
VYKSYLKLMNPRNAIIIISISFIILLAAGAAFYFGMKASEKSKKADLINTSQTTKTPSIVPPPPVTKEDKIKQLEAQTDVKVKEIISEKKNELGGLTKDGQQNLEDTLNSEMMEKRKILNGK